MTTASPLPQDRALVRLVARISAGGWFEFYDLFMTAYIALGLIHSGLYTALGTGRDSIAGFAACGFGGMFVGTLFFGWVSDHFGRKATFAWSLIAYSLLTAAMALATNVLAINVFRLLAGIGIGVQIITIDAYISELAPKDARGSLIALSQAICYTAVPVVALVAALLVPRSFAGLDGWRWVALAGALGAIAVWPIRAGLPESARWLQRQSRPLGQIFLPPYRSRTVMLSIFNVLQTIGFYGFASWIAILLQQSGHGIATSLHYTAIIAILTPLGPLLAIRAADRLERKLQIFFLGLAAGVFALALAHFSEPWAIIVFGLFITLTNTWFSCAFHAYQSELYPTAIRASAVGFVYSWSRLSSIFVGYLFAFVLRTRGVSAAFETIAAAMAVSGIIVGLWGPLTNRRELEVLAP